MDDAPTAVASFGEPELAEMAVSVLEAAGVAACADNRLLAEVNDWAPDPGGVEVCVGVAAADADHARAVPAGTAASAPAPGDAPGLRCLACGHGIGEEQDACPACGWTREVADPGPAGVR